MAVLIREPRRPDESDADFLAREEAHFQQLDREVTRLRELRAKHTGKGPKAEVKQP